MYLASIFYLVSILCQHSCVYVFKSVPNLQLGREGAVREEVWFPIPAPPQGPSLCVSGSSLMWFPCLNPLYFFPWCHLFSLPSPSPQEDLVSEASILQYSQCGQIDFVQLHHSWYKWDINNIIWLSSRSKLLASKSKLSITASPHLLRKCSPLHRPTMYSCHEVLISEKLSGTSGDH